MTDAVEDDQPAEHVPEAPPRRHDNTARNAVEWAGIVIGALLVAVIVKTFLIQAFYIPSLSMYSTLDKGDRVLVNKMSYHLHDIHHGDIVVFKRPPNEADVAIKDLIKRVVALSGETVESRDGVVFVNGKRLTETYLARGVTTKACSDPSQDLAAQVVPPHKIFVMGDNRSNSQDSRCFGAIDKDLVVGRAFVRVWPIQDFHLF